MLIRLLSLFLAALASTGLANAEPVRLGYVFSDGNLPGTLSAFQALVREHPELRGEVELVLMSESSVADIEPEEMTSLDVLVFDMMNEQMLGQFNDQHDIDIIPTVAADGAVLAVGVGLVGSEIYEGQGAVLDNRAQAYWQNGGSSNQLGLMKLALSRAGVDGLKLPNPQPSLNYGYYYPDGGDGRVFETWNEFDQWRRSNGKAKADAPSVGVGFFKAAYYSGDIALIDALIASIEEAGAVAVPYFGYPGDVGAQRLLLNQDGTPRVDVILGLNFMFADSDAWKRLDEVNVPALNLITLYGRSEEDWRTSRTGLSMFEGTFNLATPELVGTVAPTVVGTKEKVRDPLTGINAVITSPVLSQVDLAVRRGLKYAELRRKANADKSVAVLYYNYPPGKASIGASYLNVAETMANMLAKMHAEGFDVGGAPPSTDKVLADITEKARNVSSAAPGELNEMIAAGNAVRIPVSQYEGWLKGYAPVLRDKITSDWGDPADGELMTIGEGRNASLIVPVVQYGKITLTPQPSRAWGEDLVKLYHAKDLAPHHQYVAVYKWLRDGLKADAVVHVGTHGTLEWLDGRDAGLSPEDAPDALIADLPDIYIYNVDVVGEGLVARRRGAAMLVDHMVPPFVKGGLTEELAKLSELINDHHRNESKNPELAQAYHDELRTQIVEMGIAKDLGLELDSKISHRQIHEIEDYLAELKEQLIPYGLHAFGRTPEDDAIASTVDAVVSADRSQLPDERKVFSADMEDRIRTGATRELESLVAALSGEFLPAGSGGEPIRNPDAYPTGKNFYGIDPDKVPKPAAYKMGVKLADQMLADHLKEHGAYPEKVSFVIWGDETMRHEGVLESQIFHLLGTRPVWDARGKVVGVEVIPRRELGRPRVDIVIASAAEGLFGNVTRLMDEAVQRVKALEEADNLVRKHYLETREALIALGRSPEEADKLAGVRIFDEPPGTYNLNTSNIVSASGSWDDEAGFANDYIRKMGHGFGNGFWGEEMADVFRLNLSGVEKVVHSSSTMLYGSLDNDDMFMYMGGLASAVRSIDGTTPDAVVTNTRDPGNPQMTGLDKFIGQEFRSRYVNPTWIEGMQKEGYAGAAAMREFVEYLWGWDATITTAVDDAMWQETFEVYVEDKHDMGMKEYFEENSPFAYQDITARMIETVRKDYWAADEATKATLIREFIDNVNEHGAGCSAVTCENARLLEYVMDEAVKVGVPTPDIEAARAAFEGAMEQSIEVAAADLRTFANRNDALERSQRPGTSAPTDAIAELPDLQGAPELAAAQAMAEDQGYVMEEIDRSQQQPEMQTSEYRPMTRWDFAWPVVALIGLMAAWRWRGVVARGA